MKRGSFHQQEIFCHFRFTGQIMYGETFRKKQYLASGFDILRNSFVTPSICQSLFIMVKLFQVCH